MSKAQTAAQEVVEVETVEVVEPRRPAASTSDKRPPVLSTLFRIDPADIKEFMVIPGKQEDGTVYGKLVLQAVSTDPRFRGTKTCNYLLHGSLFEAANHALNGAEFTPESAETLAAALNAGYAVRIRETNRSIERNKEKETYHDFNVFSMDVAYECTPLGPKFVRRD